LVIPIIKFFQITKIKQGKTTAFKVDSEKVLKKEVEKKAALSKLVSSQSLAKIREFVVVGGDCEVGLSGKILK
jgi:hypothetical protein